MEANGTMEYIATFHHTMSTGTPLLGRLKSGFLLSEIFEHFSQKISSTLQPDRSLWLYSAHETTIANMLNSLGLFNVCDNIFTYFDIILINRNNNQTLFFCQQMRIPPYASSLHFELYKTSANDHYIQLYYRTANEENPPSLNIPGCGEKCSLDQLYDIYKDIIPEDFDSECDLPEES